MALVNTFGPVPNLCQYQPWYWPNTTDGTGSTSVAQEAYEEAEAEFCKMLTKDKRRWVLDKTTSIRDVEAAVLNAKKIYDDETKPVKGNRRKIRRWITKVTERLVYYGAVFDILSQHHPEYVALAWGAIKFVFIGILNHEDLVVKIAEAITRIGDALHCAELSFQLFPTARMKQMASQLYVYIIKFCQHAVIWYKKNALQKAIAAIVKPYDLHFKDTVAKIEYYAGIVENTSTSASRAELRDIHVKIEAMMAKMNEMHQKALATHSLSQEIRLDIKEHGKVLQGMQLRDVLNHFQLNMAPEEAFRIWQSTFARRQRTNFDLVNYPPSLFHALKAWVSSSTSLIFILRCSFHAIAKAQGAIVSTIEALRHFDKRVIWSFPTRDPQDFKRPVTTMFKTMVFQALQMSLTGNYSLPSTLSVASITGSHTDTEWAAIFRQILAANPETFVIIELEEMLQSDGPSKELFELLQSIVNQKLASKVKLLLLLYGEFIPVPAEVSALSTVSSLLTGPAWKKRQPRIKRKQTIQQVLRPLFTET